MNIPNRLSRHHFMRISRSAFVSRPGAESISSPAALASRIPGRIAPAPQTDGRADNSASPAIKVSRDVPEIFVFNGSPQFIVT
jgi:hypothetical protein